MVKNLLSFCNSKRKNGIIVNKKDESKEKSADEETKSKYTSKWNKILIEIVIMIEY